MTCRKMNIRANRRQEGQLMLEKINTAASPESQAPRLGSSVGKILPGLILSCCIAGVGFFLSKLPYCTMLSPMILSIFLGMFFNNVIRTPKVCGPGVKFSLRRVLRLAIILLGLQLTVSQVLSVGAPGLLIVVITLIASFSFTVWWGRKLGVDGKLCQLVAAGTSICGASAVIAANTAVDGSDEDVAYAVACVTVFGSLAMFIYPALPSILHLNPHDFGLWSGASIHEIGQVVAAAFQNGKESGDLATITKLARVMLLAPVVIILGIINSWLRNKSRTALNDKAERASRAKAPMPWFVIGFILLIAINSFDVIPHPERAALIKFNVFLLSVALAAMGLEADFRKLKAKGLRPLLLGASSWIFIALFSLTLIKLTHA
jgi:uncharacterized integral membrane protein (TIGR00698 family)